MRSFAGNRRGFFLVMVLVVIVVATLAAYSFTTRMLAFDRSAYLNGDLVQARIAAESGSEVVRLVLADPPQIRLENGGTFNNPNYFQAIPVSLGLDGITPCNFSVVAPALDENGQLGGLRFGLQNESARLNINALPIIHENSGAMTAALTLAGAGEEAVEEPENLAISMLMSLPGMTEDTAAAILDWLDEDDETTEPNGAEADYYEGLESKYSPTNGQILSIEELLLVRGVTPDLLFGADSNRNGMLDADEQQRFGVTIDTPGALGWSQYITIHGGEANKTFDGNLRININKDDLEVLYDELLEVLGDETLASYIVAFRIAGQTAAAAAVATGNNDNGGGGNGGDPWTAEALAELDLSGGGGTEFTQVLDLVGSTVTVGDGNNATTFSSPFEDNPIAAALYLPLIMDALTTSDADFLPGRINLNECPAELLYGISLLTEEQIETILETRTIDSEDTNRRHETWLITEGIVTTDEMRTLVPLFTCGGDVYRCQIVGYFEKGGAAHRSEFVVDATTVNPKVVAWRDLSHLGRGFDLSVLGLRSNVDASTDSAQN